MSEGDARIRVRVQPRACRNEITGWKEGSLYVRLSAPPVEGTANKACVELLADRLGVKRGQVRLVSGEKSRDKALAVEGLSQAEAERRLGREEDSVDPALEER